MIMTKDVLIFTYNLAAYQHSDKQTLSSSSGLMPSAVGMSFSGIRPG